MTYEYQSGDIVRVGPDPRFTIWGDPFPTDTLRENDVIEVKEIDDDGDIIADSPRGREGNVRPSDVEPVEIQGIRVGDEVRVTSAYPYSAEGLEKQSNRTVVAFSLDASFDGTPHPFKLDQVEFGSPAYASSVAKAGPQPIVLEAGLRIGDRVRMTKVNFADEALGKTGVLKQVDSEHAITDPYLGAYLVEPDEKGPNSVVWCVEIEGIKTMTLGSEPKKPRLVDYTGPASIHVGDTLTASRSRLVDGHPRAEIVAATVLNQSSLLSSGRGRNTGKYWCGMDISDLEHAGWKIDKVERTAPIPAAERRTPKHVVIERPQTTAGRWNPYFLKTVGTAYFEGVPDGSGTGRYVLTAVFLDRDGNVELKDNDIVYLDDLGEPVPHDELFDATHAPE